MTEPDGLAETDARLRALFDKAVDDAREGLDHEAGLNDAMRRGAESEDVDTASQQEARLGPEGYHPR